MNDPGAGLGNTTAIRTFAFTMGEGLTQTEWTDRRTVTWPDLIPLLTKHKRGRKEGPCIVPAVFRGTRRQKADADQIDLVVLDADCGHTLEEIETAVRSHGLAAPPPRAPLYVPPLPHQMQVRWEVPYRACLSFNPLI